MKKRFAPADAPRADGWRASIALGLRAASAMGRSLARETRPAAEETDRLREALCRADAILIGAGAGLSAAAGFTYGGTRFRRYFSDFADRFGIRDMYSGGFYPFPDEETRWAWWARAIYYNRFVPAPKPVHEALLALVKGKDYFVITTNVDHLFQRAGFDRSRLFYTQGDYGLFQSADPSACRTWDNECWVYEAMAAQGFVRDEDGLFQPPASGAPAMRLPSSLLPACPDGTPAALNLRVDDTFVEDEGWRKASAAYARFLRRTSGRSVLYLELGVGSNTPVIIKYPFWALTLAQPRAVYACVNRGEAYVPQAIAARSLCIDSDIADVLAELGA